MALIVGLTSHHRRLQRKMLSENRNHCSPKSSNHFCNKIGKKLPPAFASVVAAETLRRFRTQLRALPHVAHALTWIRGPKAVASSSPLDRVRASLDIAGLLQFF